MELSIRRGRRRRKRRGRIEVKAARKQHLVTCITVSLILSALQLAFTSCYAISVSTETSQQQIQLLKPAHGASKLSSSIIIITTTTTEAQSQAPTPLPSSLSHANFGSISSASSAPPPDSALIESFLIKAEQLNERPLLLPTLNQNEGSLSSSSSSLAPTDSGEDPLETSTIFPLDSDSQRQTKNRSTNNNEQQDQEMDQDHEERLLDSNRLSVALQPSPDINQQPPPAPNQIFQPKLSSPIACDIAYSQCAHRKACAPALRAYNDDCRALINNGTGQCSEKCLKALIALRSSEAGDDLVNCDCQNDEYCLQSKKRSLTCKSQVEEAVNPHTQVSCSTASWICNADQLCSTAFDYYYSYCQSLFSQNYCSPRCNNSLSILYRQPKANKLINCFCDGTEEFPCQRFRTYTERLCLHKVPTKTLPDSSIWDPDETSNMTNEPDIQLQDSHSINETNEEDEEEYNHEIETRGQSQPEDNYIPFLSGRYFTNLQQQQQQQNQQPVAKRMQKGAKQKINNSDSKADKQTVDHNSRRRHSRIFMFASTSSAASTSTSQPPGSKFLLNWLWPIHIVVLSFISHLIFTSLLLQ